MTIERKVKYVASDGTEHDSPQAAATYELAASILQLGGTFTPMHENMAEKLALSPETLRDALNTYFEDLEEHPDSPAAQAFDDMVHTGMGVMRVDPTSMFKDPPPEAPPHPDVDRPAMTLADYNRVIEFDVTKMWHCDGNHPFPVCWDPQCWHKTPAKTDNRICATCDGGPGNDGPCLCGEERWVEPDPKAGHHEPPHPSGLELTDEARKYAGLATGHTVYDWLAQGWTRQQLLDQGLAVEVRDAVGDPLDPDRIEVGEIVPGVRGFTLDVPTGTEVPRGTAMTVDHPQYCRPFGTRED